MPFVPWQAGCRDRMHVMFRQWSEAGMAFSQPIRVSPLETALGVILCHSSMTLFELRAAAQPF